MKDGLCGQRGFTLVEVIVAVGLITMAMSTLGIAMAQALTAGGKIGDDGVATNELRNAVSWLAGDVRMASASDLVDGGLPAASVMLTWTEEFQGQGTSHSASYQVVGESLERTYDGVTHTVAYRVISASFSLSGQMISASIEVSVRPGVTRTLTVNTLMRASL